MNPSTSKSSSSFLPYQRKGFKKIILPSSDDDSDQESSPKKKKEEKVCVVPGTSTKGRKKATGKAAKGGGVAGGKRKLFAGTGSELVKSTTTTVSTVNYCFEAAGGKNNKQILPTSTPAHSTFNAEIANGQGGGCMPPDNVTFAMTAIPEVRLTPKQATTSGTSGCKKVLQTPKGQKGSSDNLNLQKKPKKHEPQTSSSAQTAESKLGTLLERQERERKQMEREIEKMKEDMAIRHKKELKTLKRQSCP